MSNLFGGSSTYNYPAQPTYGEGMADAMKAQMEMLTGQTLGEDEGFKELYASALGREGGTLADVLRQFEAPLRKETAQIDTDVMRQTLLGGEKQLKVVQDPKTGKFGIPTSETQATDSTGQYELVRDQDTDAVTIMDTQGGGVLSDAEVYVQLGWLEEAPGGRHDRKGDFMNAMDVQGYKLTPEGVKAGVVLEPSGRQETANPGFTVTGTGTLGLHPKGGLATQKHISQVFKQLDTPTTTTQSFTWTNPNTGDELKEGETVTVREGTGMLDLFGPKGIAEYDPETGERVSREYGDRDPAYKEWKDKLRSGEPQEFDRDKILADYGVDVEGMSDDELAQFHYEAGGKGHPLYDPPGAAGPTYKQAGFATQADVDAGRASVVGEFMGLTSVGADVSADLARRQRAADIGDVERLGGRATEAYREQGDIRGALAAARALGPGGATTDYGRMVRQSPALQAAYEDSQADPANPFYGMSREEAGEKWFMEEAGGSIEKGAQLLGEGSFTGPTQAAPSAMPSDPLFSGTAMTSLQKTAEGLGKTTPTITGQTLGAPTGYAALDQVAGGRIGGEYDPTKTRLNILGKKVSFGGTDPLRRALISEAQSGLGQGLTSRELRNIQEGTRAAATARGRVRDIGSVQQEVEARLLEDRQRQAMNRAFAQQALGAEAGYQTSDLGRGMQAQLANLGAEQQRRQFGVQAGLGAAEFEAAQRAAADLANLQTQQAGIGRELGAAESDVERAMRQQAMSEQYRQAGLGQERAAAAQMVGLEQATGADPFQAILGRPSGAGAAMGQQIFGQAGYGLQSAPQYLNPEAGLGYISQAAANEASMWGAGQMADAAKTAGKWQAIGSAIGGICWVAREVYGAHNPAWLDFREWMLLRAPSWFRALYIGYGERFAKFISDKPRLKARIRGWMDTKIGRV